MRIKNHPVLEVPEAPKLVRFYFEGKEYEGVEGDTIASALTANDVRVLRDHGGRKRGFFCAIGNCSSCLMEVNGKTNVRVCIEPLREGMKIRRQDDKGSIFGGVERSEAQEAL